VDFIFFSGMIEFRVQVIASNVQHHKASFSNFFRLCFNNISLISHLEVQYICALFIFLPIGHILILSILENRFSFHRIYSQFPNSQHIVY